MQKGQLDIHTHALTREKVGRRETHSIEVQILHGAQKLVSRTIALQIQGGQRLIDLAHGLGVILQRGVAVFSLPIPIPVPISLLLPAALALAQQHEPVRRSTREDRALDAIAVQHQAAHMRAVGRVESRVRVREEENLQESVEVVVEQREFLVGPDGRGQRGIGGDTGE